MVGNNKNDVPIFSLGARQPPSQALLPSNLQDKEAGFHHMNDFNVYLEQALQDKTLKMLPLDIDVLPMPFLLACTCLCLKEVLCYLHVVYTS